MHPGTARLYVMSLTSHAAADIVLPVSVGPTLPTVNIGTVPAVAGNASGTGYLLIDMTVPQTANVASGLCCLPASMLILPTMRNAFGSESRISQNQ